MQQSHQFRDRRYRCLKIGLTAERPELYERIERRTEQMMAAGLVQEVENLLARGYAASLKSMQALGYRHIAHYLQGCGDLPEAVRLIKRDTRNYAKRQLTWFRADSEIRWFLPGDEEAVGKALRNFLTSGGDEDN
jgi:tRNA dimethylallyltransferase